MSSAEGPQDLGESPSRDGTTKKRPRSSPTLLTPRRNEKRIPLRVLVASDATVASLVPTTLTYETENGSNDGPNKTKEQWSICELKALTEFVLFHTSGECWPTHKHSAFWKSASEFVKSRGGAVNVTRSASACRSKVTTWLVKRYKSPKDAEACFSDRLHQVHSPLCGVSIEVQTDDMEVSALLHMFSKLPLDVHLQSLSRLFSSYLSATSSVSVPDDFLCHAAAAMINLHNGCMLDRAMVEVSLAKPVDKDSYQKNSHVHSVMSPRGYMPLDYASAVASMIWGASSATTVQPTMTSAGLRAFSCCIPPQAQYYPPHPLPTTTSSTCYYSPPTSSYYQQTTAMMYPQYGGSSSKQCSSCGKYYDDSQMMLLDSTTLPLMNSLSMKKSSVQFLDEMCTKNGWGAPIYNLHTISSGAGLFFYDVSIPAIGVTYKLTKLSPNVDEAQCFAAEHCLMQLGLASY